MPFLNRYEKVTCINYGTQITKLIIARHKKSCSAGHWFVPNVPTSLQNRELTWTITLPRNTLKQLLGLFMNGKNMTDFHSLFSLREQKLKERGGQWGLGAQSLDVAQLMGDVVDNSLTEDLETCKQFLLDC